MVDRNDSRWLDLRRKLDVLQYSHKLSAESVPLVERLVEDLVRTTESYRDLKRKTTEEEMDAAGAKWQVDYPIFSSISKQNFFENVSGCLRIVLLYVD